MKRVEEKGVGTEGLNKKEKVIYLAKNDPFLKVEELAEQVGTTSHYVRTVLSEAKLSLTKLRKRYARKMEQLSNLSTGQFLIDMVNVSEPNEVFTEQLNKIILNNYKKYQQLIKSDNFQKRVLRVSDQAEPILINNTLLIPSEEKIDSKGEINNLLNVKSADIEFGDSILEIETANYELAENLQINSGQPILEISRKILIKNQVKGLDILYISPDRCKIGLSGKEISFEVKK